MLVVEDQELNQEVADGMLTSFGLEVDAAEHGRQALAKLAAGRYDVVLMDCQMPVMDGYSATRELRRVEAGTTRVPVIAPDCGHDGRCACCMLRGGHGRLRRQAVHPRDASRSAAPRGSAARKDGAGVRLDVRQSSSS